MAELATQIEHLDQWQREQQLRYDLQTQFAELIDGNMRTEFDLQLAGDDLVGEDGRGLKEVTATALADAKATAKANPELWFEVRRRGFEQDEIAEAVAMARGEGPNTIVIESDFPPELADAEEDVGGYNVRRKQTMQRILVRTRPGHVRMYSQSLDGSNRPALEAIYARFGKKPQPGELLPQRIHQDLTPEEQANLNDELRGIYDRSLSAQFGGDWYAGRRPSDYRNTYDFVCAQPDLLDECVRLESLGWLHDQAMYDISATMQERFSARRQNDTGSLPGVVIINPALLRQEIASAGSLAREQGRAFSACGVTLKADGLDGSTENNLEQAGYGNKTSEDCEFISKECPECHEKNVKTKVHKLSGGKKIISGSCGCAVIR